MKTRISAFCDTILEAGWLLALVLVPLFFNLFSSRVFEPDKIALLRSIATLMAVALLTKWIEETEKGSLRKRLASTVRKPLVLPALLIAIAYLVATVFSVSPRISLWGSYQRLQGTYTWFSYLVIFASLLTSLRKREQLDRLLNTIILASLPVALYGIVQHYQLDPLPWGGDVTYRVAANMGNAIFVAAYLIMAIPLTLSRMMALNQENAADTPTFKFLRLTTLLLVAVQTIIWSVGGFWWGLFGGLAGIIVCWFIAERRSLPTATLLLIGAFSWTLSAQLTCVFYSQSRGPWLGLVAGLALFTLLLAHTKGWRKGLYIVLAVTLLLGSVLGWLNLSQSALAERIREVPYVGRLGELLSVESGTGKVRVLIWEGAVEMVFDDPMRTLVGYGPETMYVAYPPFYNPDLAHYESRNATPDRSHNEMFDALITTGLVGFAAYILLFMSVFYVALKWLGLVPDKKRRNLLITLLCASGALGIALPLLIDGSLRYMGVGVPLALLAGIGIYVLIVTLKKTQVEQPVSLDSWHVTLIIGILAAITAHWVEIHLGIAIVSTRIMFWALAGVLVAVGTGSITEAQVMPTPRAKARARKSSHREQEHNGGVLAGILSGAIGCILIWDYVTNPDGLSDPISVLWQSFTTMTASQQPEVTNLAILGLIIVSVCTAILVLVAQAKAQKNVLQASWGKSLGTAAAIALIVMLAYGLLHASSLDTRESLHNLIYGFAALMLGFWILLAAALWNKNEKLQTTSRSALSYISIPLLIGALFFCSSQNLSNIKADVIYKEGLRYDSAELWEEAAGIYAEAIELNPIEDYYMLFEGRALLQIATEATDSATRESYFTQALASLQNATDTAPLNPDHAANIARLYSRWAAVTTDSELLQERRGLSVQYYEKASELSPNNVGLLNEWAIALAELERYDEAMALLDHSLALDPIYTETYQAIGELYYRQQAWSEALSYYEQAASGDETNAALVTAVAHCYANLEQWETATEWYSRTVELSPESAQAWLYLGNSQENAGDLQGAEASYLQANTLASGSETVLRRLVSTSIQLNDLTTAESALLQLAAVVPDDWTVYHDLAIVYSEQGRIDEALAQIDTALSLASGSDLERLQTLQSEILVQEDTP